MELIKNQDLIFLLCSERSGSNFITKLMNNHSHICGPSTKHIINPLARNYFRYQPLIQLSNWEALIDDLLKLYQVEFSFWKSEFTKTEILNQIEHGRLDQLIKYFFTKETHINEKSMCFIKEIKVYEFYSFLKSYFPEAKFIYQVRDPRDMALSLKKNKTHKGGIIAAAKQWKVDQQNYLKIKALEELDSNILLLKYEDLVADTNKEVSSILDFLELKFESSILDMGKDTLTNKNAQTQQAWENLSKPIMTTNFNKYKEELTGQEIKYIEAICFFEMQYLGYQSNFEWSELQKIKDKEINAFAQEELRNLEYNPADGVKLNMEAKKNFYQHIQ